jgi:hypothetical protein
VHRGSVLLIAAVAVLCIVPAGAGASDATLRSTLNIWSKKIGADAHSVALAAQRRHPRRMTSSANRFHNDALQARAAVAAQKPSTAKGRRARGLALTALTDYAIAGTNWAATGRARLLHHTGEASIYAIAGARYATTGNRLLVSSGKLLR